MSFIYFIKFISAIFTFSYHCFILAISSPPIIIKLIKNVGLNGTILNIAKVTKEIKLPSITPIAPISISAKDIVIINNNIGKNTERPPQFANSR